MTLHQTDLETHHLSKPNSRQGPNRPFYPKYSHDLNCACQQPVSFIVTPKLAVLPCFNCAITCLFFLHYTLVNSVVCNSDVYGKSNSQDCAQALRRIPFAALPRSDPHSQQTYIFAEPQYMDPRFGGVSNIYRPWARAIA